MIFEIKNDEEYLYVLNETLYKFSSDIYGNEKPLFETIGEFCEFLNLPLEYFYDENGDFLYPITNDYPDLYDLPEWLQQELISKRLKYIGLDYPFCMYIYGQSDWGRLGDEKVRFLIEEKLYEYKQ